MIFPSISNENGKLSLLVLHWPPSVRLVNEQFFDFCGANKELHIERSAQGDYEIMPPTGGETWRRNLMLSAQLYNWAEIDNSGIGFDSSTGYILPSGAIRSPAVSWVKKSRLGLLTQAQKRCFLPLCPDFVIELCSPSDRYKSLRHKMKGYIENGVSLAWLIDPETQQVTIFQANASVLILEKPVALTADNLLNGFELALGKIWDVGF